MGGVQLGMAGTETVRSTDEKETVPEEETVSEEETVAEEGTVVAAALCLLHQEVAALLSSVVRQ